MLSKLFFYLLCSFTMTILVLPFMFITPLSFVYDPYLTLSSELLNINHYSFRWYNDFFTSAKWLNSMRNSIFIGISSATMATMIGTMAATWMYGARSCYKNYVLSFILTPLIIPHVVTGVALFLLYSKIQLVNTFSGIILAHTILGIPLVVISVLIAYSRYNETLTVVAYSLGAKPIYTFRYITFPLIYTGILSGWLFAFITSFDDLIITIFITGYNQLTIPIQMWSNIQDYVSPTLLAVSVLITLIVLIGLLIIFLTKGRRT